MSAISTSVTSQSQDEEYRTLLDDIQQCFDQYSINPLFTTNVENLFDIYLKSIPEQYRQHYNCHQCRRFLNYYGSIVSVDIDGGQVPLFWNFETQGFFGPVVAAMKKTVSKAKITDTLSLIQTCDLGVAQTGDWNHFAVHSKKPIGVKSRLQDYITVKRAVSEFDKDVLDRALVLLRADALYRSEKVLGQAEWLRSLYGLRDSAIWKQVATAPEGFCHPRSSMIGTLLEDLQSGVSVADAGRKFAAKMHPLQYQRPTAAPSDQTIKQAEKLVADLQVAGSLKRRFLRPDEVKAIWTPKQSAQESGGGVFDSLKSKNKFVASAAGPCVDITWEKFLRTVLPYAEQMFLNITERPMSFCALVTASNPESPPLLQWDSAEQRNPVSWYVYHMGSYPSTFSLKSGKIKVTHVALQPNMWYGEFAHQGQGVVFVLDGCKDTRNDSLGLFPEILRSEFHGVRSVIEAYSRTHKLDVTEGPAAAGILLQKTTGVRQGTIVEVETLGQRLLYNIDRWD